MTRDDPLLTAAEAAEYLRVSPAWLYGAARDGVLPAVRLGGVLRWMQSDLEAAIERGRQG